MFVNDRLDREEPCGTLPSCTITLELVVERSLELFSAEVVIQDINDNNPLFPTGNEIERLARPRCRERAFRSRSHDPDVGSNSLQTYELSRNEYFALRRRRGKTAPSTRSWNGALPTGSENQISSWC